MPSKARHYNYARGQERREEPPSVAPPDADRPDKTAAAEPGPAATIPLRALIVGNSPADAGLIVRHLERAGFQPAVKRVETPRALNAALRKEPWDFVIADARLPDFDGLSALDIVRAQDEDLPFILVSGAGGEEAAIEAMKRGVDDYITKSNPSRLGPAVRRELAVAATRRERRRLEDAAFIASRQWRTTFDALPEPIFLLDPEGKIVRCNRAFRELVGKPFQDILGRPCHSVVHGADGPIAECPFVACRRTRKRETAVIRRDGRWFQLSIDPVWDEEGALVNAVHVMADVTEARTREEAIRASETRYRELANFLPIGIFEADPEGRFLFVNRTALELSGYAEDELLSSVRFLDIIDPSDRPKAAARLARVTAGEKPVPSEFLARRKDGTTLPLLVLTHPLLKDGRPAGLRGTAMDISERKAAEAEMQRLEAQLRHQQKLEAIGTLAGGVAHEINNPINGIMNYAQLIADQAAADSPLPGFADEILREADRVATIVNGLLTFSRQDRRTHSPASLADIVESTLRLVRTIIRHDQIELAVDVPTDLPRMTCRSQQIQQVLMNLITNARDALNAKGPGYFEGKRIDIRARTFLKDGRTWIRTTVEDRGCGIAPEVRDRLFEPFFTTKPKDQGTGLGLSISHGIVRDHGGEISFESDVGLGTRFHLDLPAEAGEETESCP